MLNTSLSSSRYRQQGAVLIVSLLMLIVLTIIGISALTNSGMETRMAHNFQHSQIVFQAAETSIDKVLVAGTSVDNPFYVEANDPMVTSMSKGIDDTTTAVTYSSTELDPADHLGEASISSTNTVVYKAVGNCPGTSFGELVCHKFEVISAANIVATGARATHTLGFARAAPGMGS
jgi:hypothetical protein